MGPMVLQENIVFALKNIKFGLHVKGTPIWVDRNNARMEQAAGWVSISNSLNKNMQVSFVWDM